MSTGWVRDTDGGDAVGRKIRLSGRCGWEEMRLGRCGWEEMRLGGRYGWRYGWWEIALLKVREKGWVWQAHEGAW